jgi:hypothetical protein
MVWMDASAVNQKRILDGDSETRHPERPGQGDLGPADGQVAAGVAITESGSFLALLAHLRQQMPLLR